MRIDGGSGGASTNPAISFVIPMYNEDEIAGEAVDRVVRAGKALSRPFEVLAVNDGSTDDTAETIDRLSTSEAFVRALHLRPNCGQPAASKAGLLAARGDMVVVLDADMQTPPEIVSDLIDELESHGDGVGSVFGVTSTRKRDDPLRLLVGQAVFYFLQTNLSRHPIPHGASSFFVMRRDVAQTVGSLSFTKGNVGAVLAALGVRMTTVNYVKPRSYREDSRLGLRGHLEEALGSLALSGAACRLGVAGAVLFAGAFLAGSRGARMVLATASGASVTAVVAAESFRRSSLDQSTAPLPLYENGAAILFEGQARTNR